MLDGGIEDKCDRLDSVDDYGEGSLVNMFEIEESTNTVDVLRSDVETTRR